MGEKLQELPLYQIDAFTAVPFHGNPAAVVLLDSRSSATINAELRQKIAAELNLSETSFVETRDTSSSGTQFNTSSEFNLSWYTPVKEVPLCGHGTLAAAAAIISGEGNDTSSLSFQTNFSGVLTVRQGQELNGQPQLEMDFPNELPDSGCPSWASPGSPFMKALVGHDAALVDEIHFNSRLKYMLVKLKKGTTREQLEAIQPDFINLTAAADNDKMSMAILTVECLTDDYDILSRAFASWSGIPEDPVTGSAHAVVGPWWAKQLGKSKLRARQCSKRGGDVFLVIEGDRVKISGSTSIVSKGSLYVPLAS